MSGRHSRLRTTIATAVICCCVNHHAVNAQGPSSTRVGANPSAPRVGVIDQQRVSEKIATYTVIGAVHNPDVYASSETSLSIDDLLKAAGGLNAHASPNVRVVRNQKVVYQLFHSPENENPSESLLPGDILIVLTRDAAMLPPPEVVPVACVGLLDRPVVLPLDPAIRDLGILLSELGQSPELISSVRVISPVKETRGELVAGSVIVFPPNLVNRVPIVKQGFFPDIVPIASSNGSTVNAAPSDSQPQTMAVSEAAAPSQLPQSQLPVISPLTSEELAAVDGPVIQPAQPATKLKGSVNVAELMSAQSANQPAALVPVATAPAGNAEESATAAKPAADANAAMAATATEKASSEGAEKTAIDAAAAPVTVAASTESANTAVDPTAKAATESAPAAVTTSVAQNASAGSGTDSGVEAATQSSTSKEQALPGNSKGAASQPAMPDLEMPLAGMPQIVPGVANQTGEGNQQRLSALNFGNPATPHVFKIDEQQRSQEMVRSGPQALFQNSHAGVASENQNETIPPPYYEQISRNVAMSGQFQRPPSTSFSQTTYSEGPARQGSGQPSRFAVMERAEFGSHEGPQHAAPSFNPAPWQNSGIQQVSNQEYDLGSLDAASTPVVSEPVVVKPKKFALLKNVLFTTLFVLGAFGTVASWIYWQSKKRYDEEGFEEDFVEPISLHREQSLIQPASSEAVGQASSSPSTTLTSQKLVMPIRAEETSSAVSPTATANTAKTTKSEQSATLQTESVQASLVGQTSGDDQASGSSALFETETVLDLKQDTVVDQVAVVHQTAKSIQAPNATTPRAESSPQLSVLRWSEESAEEVQVSVVTETIESVNTVENEKRVLNQQATSEVNSSSTSQSTVQTTVMESPVLVAPAAQERREAVAVQPAPVVTAKAAEPKQTSSPAPVTTPSVTPQPLTVEAQDVIAETTPCIEPCESDAHLQSIPKQIVDLVGRKVPMIEEKVVVPKQWPLHGTVVGHRRLILDQAHVSVNPPHFPIENLSGQTGTKPTASPVDQEKRLRQSIRKVISTVVQAGYVDLDAKSYSSFSEDEDLEIQPEAAVDLAAEEARSLEEIQQLSMDVANVVGDQNWFTKKPVVVSQFDIVQPEDSEGVASSPLERALRTLASEKQ